jgi:hypothetical protein
MTALLIPNSMPYTYGQMTNQVVGRLIQSATQLARLDAAIKAAWDAYGGIPGAQFEQGAGAPQNLFGVAADNADPGRQGVVYSTTVVELLTAWGTFWAVAQPLVSKLDTGAMTM